MKLVCPLALVLAVALPAAARAQVYCVTFQDPRTAKRFPTACINLPDGRPALVGEAKSGISLQNGRINYQGDKGANELWVVNTADPSAVPYVLEGTTYAPAKKVKGGVVSVSGNQIKEIQILLPGTSLHGLAREHGIRSARVAEAQARRDACKPASPEWTAAHVRLLSEMEQQHSWLANTIFPEAAAKLGKEIEKQRKTVAKEARAQRLAAALATVAAVPVPAKLTEVAAKLAPKSQFGVQESLHLRITYEKALPDEQVKELLALGERMIDGFRAEFVDPHVGEDFEDRIPESRFMELWFGPEEPVAHERFLTDYYGTSWGDHKEERLAAMSGRYRRKTAPEYLDYWKIADNKDFENIVAHELGHVLANLHCNAGREGDLPSWIEEGVGYWLAVSYLGSNTVTCRQFARDQYAKSGEERQIERAVLMGQTEIYTQSALEHGPPPDRLLAQPLHLMEDADLAKAWSLFEWIAAEQGKPGQLWLRGLCDVFAATGKADVGSGKDEPEAITVRAQMSF
jgi:hypothetical protein